MRFSDCELSRERAAVSPAGDKVYVTGTSGGGFTTAQDYATIAYKGEPGPHAAGIALRRTEPDERRGHQHDHRHCRRAYLVGDPTAGPA